MSSRPQDKDGENSPSQSSGPQDSRARFPEPRRASSPRWGPTPGARAEVHRWAKRVLEHPASTLAKSLELTLADVTLYDLELVALACSHVEIAEASGVSVRNPAGLLFHCLRHGGDGTRKHGWHELATPNFEEHEENLALARAPELPRRRERPAAENPESKLAAQDVKPVGEVLDKYSAFLRRQP